MGDFKAFSFRIDFGIVNCLGPFALTQAGISEEAEETRSVFGYLIEELSKLFKIYWLIFFAMSLSILSKFNRIDSSFSKISKDFLKASSALVNKLFNFISPACF